MLQRILVGLDGSPLAETVLPYVRTLSKGLRAEVTLFHVVHVPEELRKAERHPTLEQLIQRAEPQALDYLRKMEQQLTSVGVKARSVVDVGDAAVEIVEYADRERMDLIALATHGRSGVQRWLYGSVAETVLHTTRTPVLLIRPTEERTVQPHELNRILVPLDGSPLAEAVLPLAETLAAAFTVPIVLLRAVEPIYIFTEPTTGGGAAYPDILEALEEAAQGYLNERTADLRSKGFSVTTVIPTGSPAIEIGEYAQEHPGSLVVMATHGRTGIAGVLLGSVARRVLRQAGAPILLVRPPAPPITAA